MGNLYVDLPTGKLLRRIAYRCGQLGLTSLASLTLTLQAQAQAKNNASFFADDAGARRAASISPLTTALRDARPLTLNVSGLGAALATAPLETQAGATPLVVTLPLPNGADARFRVVETSVMEPALAAKYPGISTYTGVGVDDPTATVRLST
ncbi:MAG: hypothetical protein EOO36_13115 [Cytophagaceae bacterium]|nr:MAG: hypothetical protein EOO36_13115 [Cytophagaceae bacterium]